MLYLGRSPRGPCPRESRSLFTRGGLSLQACSLRRLIMSREDPLGPLAEVMAHEERVKGQRRALGKLAVGWFIAFLMVASISRWFMHRLV